MPSWSLANADDLARQHRYTFYKPSDSLIQRVAIGEVVKLIFRFESEDPEAPSAERMWVLVDEIGPQGVFKGRLNNEPVHIVDLKLDDPIEFESCHIISTEHEDNDNIVEKYIKRCFVTNRVLYDGEPVGYFYREEPDREDDSGWRFMVNDETEEYMDNADNTAYVSLGAVLSEDDSFIGFLDFPPGAAFERDAESGQFLACVDQG
jgi:hypothetical protein